MTTLHPGIKRDQIRPCGICGQGIARDGSMVFYRLTIEHFVVDHAAVQAQRGLELLLRSPALAQVMGTDPDLATRAGEPASLLVCGECMFSRSLAEAFEVADAD